MNIVDNNNNEIFDHTKECLIHGHIVNMNSDNYQCYGCIKVLRYKYSYSNLYNRSKYHDVRKHESRSFDSSKYHDDDHLYNL